jgi:acyl dehydratase
VNPSEGAPASAALHPAFVSGALLLSLLGRLRSTMENVRFAYASTMSIFYGFDNVRFFEPVPAPVTIRLHLRIVDAKMLDRSTLHVVYGHRLETRQGATALTADAINRIHLRAGFIEKTDVH